MLVVLVDVAAGGVGLPDLYQAVSDGTAVAIRDASRDDDALAQRLAFVLAGQIVVQLPYRAASVGGARGIGEGPGEYYQGLLRRPEARRHVVRIQVWRLCLAVGIHDSSQALLPLAPLSFRLPSPRLSRYPNVCVTEHEGPGNLTMTTTPFARPRFSPSGRAGSGVLPRWAARWCRALVPPGDPSPSPPSPARR